MRLRVLPSLAVLAACSLLTGVGCGTGGPAPGRDAGSGDPTRTVLRLGHFPNLTHAQALLARADGSLEKALGGRVEWTTFNAGPSAVEALFAGAIDATYIGPNPAINGHLKSRGEAFVLVAGAASGGAALVVRPASGIRTDRDFHGRRVATPQLGNTQDVAARIWFQQRGYTTTEKGGDLTILPLANPDQLLMMQKGEIDAAWTIEPWVSRLEQEAGAQVLVEERTLWPEGRYPTALLVVRREYLASHPERVRALVGAHVDETLRLRSGAEALVPELSAMVKQLTSKALPDSVIRSALSRLEFIWDPLESAIARSADDAHRVGFLRVRPDLTGLVERGPLDAVLRQKGMAAGSVTR